MRRLRMIVLILLLIMQQCLPIQVMAVISPENFLKVGERIAGFEVIETGAISLIEGETILFRHKQSGLQLLYIKNEDEQGTFNISFRTPTKNDKGANHVLEHMILSGSEKYPLKDLLFTITNQTYCSYANAMTTSTMTSYTVASTSETQLLKLVDVYMDCVFNPLFYEEPNLFQREAWRYDKEEDEDLTLTGVVYNEMKGRTSSINHILTQDYLDTLFPNSTLSYEAGGSPQEITQLTYEEAVAIHQTYYKPSNALIILYGDLEYKPFLELLDKTYLSEGNKEEVIVDYKEEPTFLESVNKSYIHPINSQPNSSETYYTSYIYAMSGINQFEDVGLSLIAQYLNAEGSILRQKFKEWDLDGYLNVSYDSSLPQPVLAFEVQGDIQEEVLKSLIEEAVAELLEEGFQADLMNSIMATINFNHALMNEEKEAGINLALAIAQDWAVSGNVDYYYNLESHLNQFEADLENNKLKELLQKYILNNTHSALITTRFELEGLEENNKVVAPNLQEQEAKLSQEELARMIEETAHFKAWNEKESEKSLINGLQTVDVEDLVVEYPRYEVEDQTVEGIRYLSTSLEDEELMVGSLLFDTSAVTVEQLHYLQLYTGLLGNIGTHTYTQSELHTLLNTYTYGLRIDTTTWSNLQKDQSYKPVMELFWVGLGEEVESSVGLLEEILFNTDFDQIEVLLAYIREAKMTYRNYFQESSYELLIEYNRASYYSDQSYSVYMKQTAYYHFLEEIENLLQVRPREVVANLEAIRDIVLNQTNLITLYVGASEYKRDFNQAMDEVIKKLSKKQIEPKDYSRIPIVSPRLGIEVDTDVNYNMLFAPFEALEVSFNGKYIPLMLALSDCYLTPQLRFQNNVYTNIESVSINGINLSTYMDPYIDKTLKVYKELGRFARGYDLSEEDLKGYILQAARGYLTQEGKLSGGFNALIDVLIGYDSQEAKQKILEEIKAAKPSDLEIMATLFDKLIEVGSWTSIADTQSLEEHGNLYERIISLEEGEGQLRELAYLTKGQFIEILLGTDVYAQAVYLEIISGGPEEVLSKEDMAIGLYKILTLEGFIDETYQSRVRIANQEALTSDGKVAAEYLITYGILTLDNQGNFKGEELIAYTKLVNVLEAIENYLLKQVA